MSTVAFPHSTFLHSQLKPAELRVVQVLEIGLAITAPLWLYALFFPDGYDYGRGLILGLVLICANMVLVLKVSKVDLCAHRVMPVAYLAKLAAAGAYIYMVQHLFQGSDLIGYQDAGTQNAADFLVTHQWWRSGVGTNTDFMISVVTGLYIITGPCLALGITLFATLAFWGEYLIYRACCVSLKTVNRGRAALLLMLFPSIVFWSASLGKEALMYFAIGLAAYGVARLTRSPSPIAFLSLGTGFALAAVVRPHVAALLAVAITATYFFTKNANGAAGIVIKIFSLPLLAYGSWFSFHQATQFLKAESVSAGFKVIHKLGQDTAYGGSMTAANESLSSRLVQAPFLLFRPFPWEVHNMQAAVASLEGVLLFWLLWSWRRDFLSGVRRIRSDATVLFSIIYCLFYSVMLASALSNIGLIARQRVLMAPFALMLFCTRSEGKDGFASRWFQSASAAAQGTRRPPPLRARVRAG